MKPWNELLNNIAQKLGLSVAEIRDKSPDEMRDYLEKRNKNKFKITFFHNSGLISSEEIDHQIDKFLEERNKQ